MKHDIIVFLNGYLVKHVIHFHKDLKYLKSCRNTPSRLCKRSLFLSYSRIEQNIGHRTYRETKDMATEYSAAKGVFESVMDENGYGHWVRKPLEVDMFHL